MSLVIIKIIILKDSAWKKKNARAHTHARTHTNTNTFIIYQQTDSGWLGVGFSRVKISGLIRTHIRTSTSGPQHQDLSSGTLYAHRPNYNHRPPTLHTHFNCKDLHFCPHHVLCSNGLKWTPHLSIKHGGAAVETRVRRVPEIM